VSLTDDIGQALAAWDRAVTAGLDAAAPSGVAAPADDTGTFLDWIAAMTPLDPQGVALIEGARALRAEIAAGTASTEAPDIYRGEP